MPKTRTAEELELTDDELSAVEEMDDLLDDDDDAPESRVDDLDDDDEPSDDAEDRALAIEEERHREESLDEERPCPVCGRTYDSEPELEFHLNKRHPDYDPSPPAPEPEPEATGDLADVLEDVLGAPDADEAEDDDEPASVQVAAPRQRRRRTKAEILAAKDDVARQRAAEKANGKEPPETAKQDREFLSATMGRRDDDEVARARREAIERLHAQHPDVFVGAVASRPEPLSELEIGEGRDLVDDDSATIADFPTHSGFALAGQAVRIKPQPWVEVKVSIAGNLPEVADFLRALAIAAEGAGVDVS